MKRLLPVLLALSFASLSPAAEPTDLQVILTHSILPSSLPLQEVVAYTESRVLSMPDVKSVAEWEKYANQYRQGMLDRVVFRGEAAKWREAKPRVEWMGEMAGGPGYKLKKLRYEALPGLWIPAILYEPEKISGKVPVSLAVNGHEGIGKSVEYKQTRCINQAKRGIIVLNLEWLGMGQLRGDGFVHYRASQLDLCGTAAVAPFFLAMQRGLDILLAHPNADLQRVAVSGLSGGGWQTIFLSSLDPRVTLCNPVAGYSSFKTRARFPSDLGDTEQTPCDMATVADYAHLTALLAPRPTLLTFNAKDDCCFRADHALDPLLAATVPIFKLYGKESNLRQHVNEDPGTHNYLQENREQFYALLKDFFAKDDPNFSAKEIDSKDEIKKHEDLIVELPADNLDFHKIALALSQDLPREKVPGDAGGRESWRKPAREKLRALVRAKDYKVAAEQVGTEEKGDLKATYWRLRMNNEWTVPAVEIVRGEPKSPLPAGEPVLQSPLPAGGTKGGAVLLVTDSGRAHATTAVAPLLADGRRVIAVDPFYFGESRIEPRDHLYAMLVAGVGDRPLGIQASQVVAVARWLREERKVGPVELEAVGRRSSLFTLIAAALDEGRGNEPVRTIGAFGSLKEIINENMKIDDAPELFCFGLLEAFDVEQLKAIAGLP
jgi:hypothetical protein